MNEELPLIENEAQFTQDMHDELSFGVNLDMHDKLNFGVNLDANKKEDE